MALRMQALSSIYIIKLRRFVFVVNNIFSSSISIVSPRAAKIRFDASEIYYRPADAIFDS